MGVCLENPLHYEGSVVSGVGARTLVDKGGVLLGEGKMFGVGAEANVADMPVGSQPEIYLTFFYRKQRQFYIIIVLLQDRWYILNSIRYIFFWQKNFNTRYKYCV
jgi:hypothetical protein